METQETLLPFENPRREGRQREAAADELGVARCPVCSAPMTMRVDCRGPRFVCLCEDSRIRAAA